MKHVKVFGSGCPRCMQTADRIEAQAAILGIEIEIEKVADYAEMARAGITATPAVTVEGKLVHAGGLPKNEDIETWLKS